MGDNVDQALSQLAATREQLDRGINELFHRLPAPPPEPKRGRGGLLLLAATVLAVGAFATVRGRGGG